MPPAPEVCRLAEDDWEVLRSLRLAALADSPDAFGSTLAEEQAYDEPDWRDWVRRAAVFVVRRAGVPVGLAAGVAAEDAHERKVVAAWVHPDHRRSGVATALIAVLEEWARGERAAALTLWVARHNEPARAMYLRRGFTPTGDVRPLPSNPGVLEDRLALRLD